MIPPSSKFDRRPERACHTGLLMAATLWIFASTVFCQPRLTVKRATSYLPGDQISPEITVLDRDLKPLGLLDLFDKDSKVVVLVLFGGGMKSRPDELEFRGSLWCQDSFDDLSVQRALYQYFKGRSVQFIGVAVPPVYKPSAYGWGDDDFLGQPENSSIYLDAARSFVSATETEVLTKLIPYAEVYYDPRFRLLQNKEERILGPEYGPVHAWQGKFKWHLDPRKYGAPTLWFLSSRGVVMAAPLFGNEYDGDPPQIAYGFREARELIESLLEQ